jgi:glycosyltransferase involved in cell wall biosynthesis
MDAREGEPVVLHVITSLAVGGAERQLVNVVRGTAVRGIRHVVCHLGPPSDLAPVLRDAGVEVLRLSERRRRRYVGAYRRLAPLIDRLEPDVVHSWLFHARFATCLGNCRKPPSHLASLQGTDYDPDSIVATGLSTRKMAVQRHVERALAARTATRFVAASQAVKDAYVGRIGITADRIAVIPNSVDPDRICTDPAAGRAFRRNLGIADDAFLFASVGRLIPGKGHHDLLHAFESLAGTDAEAVLLVAGEGPLARSLRGIAPDLHALGRIRLLGTVTDVGALLSAADAFVFPSSSEGFPLALAEAMLAGLPAVAADAPAMHELAGDRPALLLTPRGDVGALAGCMRRLRSDRGFGGELGDAARHRATELYSVARTAPLWLEQYRAALSGD